MTLSENDASLLRAVGLSNASDSSGAKGSEVQLLLTDSDLGFDKLRVGFCPSDQTQNLSYTPKL